MKKRIITMMVVLVAILTLASCEQKVVGIITPDGYIEVVDIPTESDFIIPTPQDVEEAFESLQSDVSDYVAEVEDYVDYNTNYAQYMIPYCLESEIDATNENWHWFNKLIDYVTYGSMEYQVNILYEDLELEEAQIEFVMTFAPYFEVYDWAEESRGYATKHFEGNFEIQGYEYVVRFACVGKAVRPYYVRIGTYYYECDPNNWQDVRELGNHINSVTECTGYRKWKAEDETAAYEKIDVISSLTDDPKLNEYLLECKVNEGYYNRAGTWIGIGDKRFSEQEEADYIEYLTWDYYCQDSQFPDPADFDFEYFDPYYGYECTREEFYHEQWYLENEMRTPDLAPIDEYVETMLYLEEYYDCFYNGLDTSWYNEDNYGGHKLPDHFFTLTRSELYIEGASNLPDGDINAGASDW